MFDKELFLRGFLYVASAKFTRYENGFIVW